MAIHSSILPWRIPRTGCSSKDHKESDTSEQLTLYLACIKYTEKVVTLQVFFFFFFFNSGLLVASPVKYR